MLARLDPVSGVPDWYLTDYIGSVRAIVRDASGYSNGLEVLDEITYDSFGNVLSETNPSAGDRFKFTARELDAALSLYYYRARWYDPQLSRFLREDPLSFTAGDTNLYRYVHNRPNSYTDPTGKYLVVGFGEHMNWLNWLWGLGINAVGWPIYEYGRPTLVYIYIPFEERERLREILNAEVAAGRLNREWAENLLRGLAGNIHVRGHGDLSISWTNLDEDVILQIVSANEGAAGRVFNSRPNGFTLTVGIQGAVHLFLGYGVVSYDFNIGYCKRYGWTWTITKTDTWGRGVGLGVLIGPHCMLTNAGSVHELAGWCTEEGVYISWLPWWSGWSLWEVHGSNYEGVDIGTPPGFGIGIGYCKGDCRTRELP